MRTAHPIKAAGGRVGLASGGMPYASNGMGLDIPDDIPGAKLSPGQAPGQSASGLSQLGSMAGSANSIMGLLGKIFADGGRVGKADGGAMDWDPSPEDYPPPNVGTINRGPVAPAANVPRGTSGLSPAPEARQSEFQNDLGRIGKWWSGQQDQERRTREANLAVADAQRKAGYFQPMTPEERSAVNTGVVSAQQNLQKVIASPPGLSPTPAPVPAPAAKPAGLAPDPTIRTMPSMSSPMLDKAAGAAQSAYQASPGLAPTQLQSPAPTAPTAFTPPSGGLVPTAGAPDASGKDSKGHFADVMDTLKKGLSASDLDKKENLIPLLTGIAAMGTAPTRSLGVALAAGVGAGAQAYQPTQESIAGVRNMDAGTFAIANEQAMKNGMVILADGSRMLLGQYRELLAQRRAPKTMADAMANRVTGQPQGSPADGAVTQAQTAIDALPKSPEGHSYVQNAGSHQIDQDYQRLNGLASPQQWDNERQISGRTEASVAANADSARRVGGTLNQLSPTLMSMPDTGLSSGHFNDLKVGIVNRIEDFANTVAGVAGVKVPESLQIGRFDPKDPAALSAASKKLSGLLQFAQANGADQDSLGALRTAAETVPNVSLTKNQARVVLAGLYIDKQRALDTAQYMNEYKGNVQARHPGQGDLYLAHSALSASRADLPEQQYAVAKDLLVAALPSIPQILKDPHAKEKLDAIGERNGVHNFSRFVMNQ